tara:strand:+ start:1875 stop:3206 length:1332 start_codon:yes stop_codon:yes gene_type:complete
MFKIYNSLSKKKEDFVPNDPDHIKFYACGPTVYNKIHIGNARAFISADLLAKVLKGMYSKVTYVCNITDIDDKIIDAAKEENLSIKDISAKYFNQYQEDTALLGISKPDIQPFATDYIDDMIAYIEKLIASDNAYEKNGNVLFRVSSFSNYGCLSDRKLDEHESGSRVKVEDFKESANDFTLWKPSLDDDPGWDSPWGRGRPGWHLECSVMSESTLDIPFDIHSGGNDLKFPHHDNEIAQTCAYHDNEDPTSFAKYWVHNGFLNLEDEKMSKSLGNVIYIDQLLKKYKGNEVRLALLSTHYRQPIPWSEDLLDQSHNIYVKLQNAFKKYGEIKEKFHTDSKIAEILMDDLNTPLAIRTMQDLVSEPNENIENEIATFKYIFEGSNQDLSLSDEQVNEINKLVKERDDARNSGDYDRADKIRDKLSKMNVSIKDVNGKTEWEIL